MASYTKVSKNVPSNERVATVTNVVAGDRIDLVDILHRPAKKLIFNLSADTDVVEYKINTLRRINPTPNKNETLNPFELTKGSLGQEQVLIWSGTGDIFTATGGTVLETIDGLKISSIEIISISVASGIGSITINCS